ncbi:MAG TPA: hypothetical protein VK737_06285 [Opitutales bacterium]|jgi:hypothetical protein|nr:hypothetical protein [Opitutales bacterium]
MAVYRVMVSREVLRMDKPSRRERKRILMFLDHLAVDPFQEGDFQDRDEDGRDLQIKIIGKYALAFRADHAAREVRVTEITEADI